MSTSYKSIGVVTNATSSSSAAASASSSADGAAIASFDRSEASFWARHYRLGSPALLASIRDTVGEGNAAADHEVVVSRVAAGHSVNRVAFRPGAAGAAGRLAVASGPRVSLYPTRPRRRGDALPNAETVPDRHLPCRDVARCCAYRADGRLLAVGADDGTTRVTDATTRATLRTFSDRVVVRAPVRDAAWFRNGRRLLVVGDDAAVRVYGLSSSDGDGPSLRLTGHADAVRSCAVVRHADRRTLALTGSYDHTVRVWDVGEAQGEARDEDRCLTVIDHGAPVEAIVALPPKHVDEEHDDDNDDDADAELLVLSAGGTSIKLWNALTGRLLAVADDGHAKTISTLCLVRPSQLLQGYSDEDRLVHEERLRLPRLLSGGLDGLIRVHSLDVEKREITVLHGVKTNSPVTTVRLSPDGAVLVSGTSDGFLSLRRRRRTTSVPVQQSRKRARSRPRGGTYSHFMRGTEVPLVENRGTDDAVTDVGRDNGDDGGTPRSKRLRVFDRALRRFRYGEALDEALATKNPAAVTAVLEELGRRRGLAEALDDRDEETLEPILSFAARYVARPRSSPVLLGVLDPHLTDVYRNVVGQSAVVDELFKGRLLRHVRTEVRAQTALAGLMGQIDAVLTRREIVRGETREREETLEEEDDDDNDEE